VKFKPEKWNSRCGYSQDNLCTIMQCSFILWHRQPTSKWISSPFISSLWISQTKPAFLPSFSSSRATQNNEPKQLPDYWERELFIQTRCNCSWISLFLIWDELNAASRIQSERGGSRHMKNLAPIGQTRKVFLLSRQKCVSRVQQHLSRCSNDRRQRKDGQFYVWKLPFYFSFFFFTIGNNRPRQVCW